LPDNPNPAAFAFLIKVAYCAVEMPGKTSGELGVNFVLLCLPQQTPAGVNPIEY
jgi:hypothetical protein